MQHQWVRHVVWKLTVVSDPVTDEPSIWVVGDESEQLVDGCQTCGEIMTLQSIKTPCPGEESPADSADISSSRP
jgi:hypothetical protein